MITTLHRQLLGLLALALCLAMTSGCTKAHKIRSLLSDAQHDFNAQHYDAAELEYRKVLRLSRGTEPVAYRQLGLLYYEEGRLGEANGYLTQALQLDPKNFQVQLKLAELNALGGRVPDALKLLEPVLLNDPANEDGLLLLVQLTRTNDLPALRTCPPCANGWKHSPAKEAKAWRHVSPLWVGLTSKNKS
jgi:tetratricopeptide (TPR) repeat protein